MPFPHGSNASRVAQLVVCLLFATAFFAALLIATSAHAQFRASSHGTVTDPSGAVPSPVIRSRLRSCIERTSYRVHRGIPAYAHQRMPRREAEAG